MRWFFGANKRNEDEQARPLVTHYVSSSPPTVNVNPVNSEPRVRSSVGGGKRSYKRLHHYDRMTLSPFRKFQLYRRIPWKFMLNLTVALLSASFFIVRNTSYSSYIDNTVDSLRMLLGDTSVTADPLENVKIDSVDDFLQHMSTSVNGYFALPEKGLTEFNISAELEMSIGLINGSTVDAFITREQPLGPFTNLSAQKAAEQLQQVNTIRIVFLLVHPWTRGTSGDEISFQWSCNAAYKFGIGAGRARYSVMVANKMVHNGRKVLLVINSLILVFAVPSLLLTLKALIKSIQAFFYAKRHLNHEPADEDEMVWSRLDLADKLAFINLWHIGTAFGDAMLIIGCMLSYARQMGFSKDEYDKISSANVCHSMGVFLVWVGLMKYLEWNSEFYMLILAVKASAGRVLKFIITVSPLYIAYALVGMACFSNHPELFGDIFKASQTIFALLNGDSILLVYQTLQAHSDLGYKVFAQIYLYSFCVLFITTVLNVFIFIIESGYDAAISAVYGEDDELSVFIDHERLQQILEAARDNDPDFAQAMSIMRNPSMNRGVSPSPGRHSWYSSPYVSNSESVGPYRRPAWQRPTYRRRPSFGSERHHNSVNQATAPQFSAQPPLSRGHVHSSADNLLAPPKSRRRSLSDGALQPMESPHRPAAHGEPGLDTTAEERDRGGVEVGADGGLFPAEHEPDSEGIALNVPSTQHTGGAASVENDVFRSSFPEAGMVSGSRSKPSSEIQWRTDGTPTSSPRRGQGGEAYGSETDAGNKRRRKSRKLKSASARAETAKARQILESIEEQQRQIYRLVDNLRSELLDDA